MTLVGRPPRWGSTRSCEATPLGLAPACPAPTSTSGWRRMLLPFLLAGPRFPWLTLERWGALPQGPWSAPLAPSSLCFMAAL